MNGKFIFNAPNWYIFWRYPGLFFENTARSLASKRILAPISYTTQQRWLGSPTWQQLFWFSSCSAFTLHLMTVSVILLSFPINHSIQNLKKKKLSNFVYSVYVHLPPVPIDFGNKQKRSCDVCMCSPFRDIAALRKPSNVQFCR